MGTFLEKTAPAQPFGARGFALCRELAGAKVQPISGPAVLGGAARPPQANLPLPLFLKPDFPATSPPPRRSAHHCCAWIKPRFTGPRGQRGPDAEFPIQKLTLKPEESGDIVMNLLIVEDNGQLAELTAVLLRSLDRKAQRIQNITLVADLETAMDCLPEHDVVLCDGQFPLSPNSRFVVEEWDVVRHEAARRGIHFVLYTGCPRALDGARDSRTAALSKPAPIAEIYAAITSHPLSVPAREDQRRVAEN